jgi:hypothetical protein
MRKIRIIEQISLDSVIQAPGGPNETATTPTGDGARREGGCIDLHVSADPFDAERINVCERWPDRASLDAWRKIADPPEVAFREIHVGLFRTERAESPF